MNLIEEAHAIKSRLENIGFTVTNLHNISEVYKVDCNTSNVVKLHRGLGEILVKENFEEGDDVHNLLKDMFSALDDAIDFYKKKHKRRTFPKTINIFQLISDLNNVDSVTFFKEILKETSDFPKEKNNEIPKEESVKVAKTKMINKMILRAIKRKGS